MAGYKYYKNAWRHENETWYSLLSLFPALRPLSLHASLFVALQKVPSACTLTFALKLPCTYTYKYKQTLNDAHRIWIRDPRNCVSSAGV